MTERTRPSERLLGRLREQGLIPAGAPAVVIPIRVGRAAKAQGAWAWYVLEPGTWAELHIGSQFTISQCIRARTWDVHTVAGDTHVDPSPEDRQRFGSSRP